ncbi:MAG: hypothetical protein Q9170_001113 [Blastenia crenularia]
MSLTKELLRVPKGPLQGDDDQGISVGIVANEPPDAFDDFESHEEADEDSTEFELEKAVFGDAAGFHERLKAHGVSKANRDFFITAQGDEAIEAGDEIRDIDDADLFILDSGPSLGPLSLVTSRQDHDAFSDASDAAWHDSDDERITVSLQLHPRLRKLRDYEDEDLVDGREYTKRLRRQFERLHPLPEWAIQAQNKRDRPKNQRCNFDAMEVPSQGSSSDDGMSVDSSYLSAPPLAELLQKPSTFLRPTQGVAQGKRKLRPELIDIQRTKDVGEAQPVGFFSNPPNGSKIIFAGQRRYFHSWDLSSGRVDKVSRVYGHQSEQKSMGRFKLSRCGKWMGLVGTHRKGGGLINVLDAHTMQWIAEVRVESKGGVADFEWWGDGEGMIVIGKGGEAVEWDGRQKKIVGRWMDEGAVGTTVLVTGGHGNGPKSLGGDRWVAVGSSSGIVNIYDRKNWKEENVNTNPRPNKVFDQLTTPTSHVTFSPDGQLMVMASRWKRDALRLGKDISFIPIVLLIDANYSASPFLYRVQKLANIFDAAGPYNCGCLLAYLGDACCS